MGSADPSPENGERGKSHSTEESLCRECGTALTYRGRGRPRSYCESCSPRRRSLGPRFEERRVCAECGSSYIARTATAVVCRDPRCRKERRRKQAHDGRDERTRERERTNDRRRAQLHKDERLRQRRLAAAEAFASIGSRPSALELQRAPKPVSRWTPEYKLIADRERRQRSHPTPFIAGPCAECGRTFVSKGLARFCEGECARRNQRRVGKAKRDKRLRDRPRDRISLPRLAKRDGWRCHICCGRVTRRNWSIDHLVPVSAGGMGTWDNVALAHHRCNSLRSNKGMAQLLLVGAP
jgi:hypothetical protein